MDKKLCENIKERGKWTKSYCYFCEDRKRCKEKKS